MAKSMRFTRLEIGMKELQCKLDNAKQENKRLCERRQELEDANKILKITRAQQEVVIGNLTISKNTLKREKIKLQFKLDEAKRENRRLCERNQQLEDVNEDLNTGMTGGSRVYVIFNNLHLHPNYLIT